jgi:hypothetical protein
MKPIVTSITLMANPRQKVAWECEKALMDEADTGRAFIRTYVLHTVRRMDDDNLIIILSQGWVWQWLCFLGYGLICVGITISE